ncbi:hypothetical protein E1B28_012670 [Marasmius oreades]|uniref:Cytochrome P450 n=1 Tax=Marasmius oreades TaxID=181124 RepID=A0A9P7UP70_9AGAR|nr:uncharacterized protein E1B28_012670 [Marasmius oreades]KAG7088700.1 hypothetical protein E1B28_012670 [Marasmius oreades]
MYLSSAPAKIACLSIFALVAIVIWVLRFSFKDNLKTKRPPGPRPLPFIGHLLYLDIHAPWLIYQRWGKIYGALTHINIFSSSLVVVNKLQSCQELFIKRGQVYSDRPSMKMLDLMGWTFNLAFIGYHDRRRRQYREEMRRGVGRSALNNAQHIVSQRRDQLLLDLSQTPDAFLDHLLYYTGSVILQHTYGFTDHEGHRSFIRDIAIPAIEGLSESSFFDAQVLFAFPFLARLPSWFPGTGFMKVATKQLSLVTELRELPLKMIENQEPENSQSSWAMNMLQESESNRASPNALSKDNIMDIAATAVTGGFHTTTSVLQTVFLALVMNPTVQDRAHEEIDHVIGRGRLPSFNDRELLPYITAICKEAVRWHTPVPLAFHTASETDEYQGQKILKGTTFIANIWAMARDQDDFEDADKFYPERFLNDDGTLDAHNTSGDVVWGFGRRSCPGRLFAESTIWLTVASILSVYKISKAKASDGKDVNVREEYLNRGLFSRPAPFQCSITFRSEETASLLMDK